MKKSYGETPFKVSEIVALMAGLNMNAVSLRHDEIDPKDPYEVRYAEYKDHLKTLYHYEVANDSTLSGEQTADLREAFETIKELIYEGKIEPQLDPYSKEGFEMQMETIYSDLDCRGITGDRADNAVKRREFELVMKFNYPFLKEDVIACFKKHGIVDKYFNPAKKTEQALTPIPWRGDKSDFGCVVKLLYENKYIEANSLEGALCIMSPHFSGVNSNAKSLNVLINKREKNSTWFIDAKLPKANTTK